MNPLVQLLPEGFENGVSWIRCFIVHVEHRLPHSFAHILQAAFVGRSYELIEIIRPDIKAVVESVALTIVARRQLIALLSFTVYEIQSGFLFLGFLVPFHESYIKGISLDLKCFGIVALDEFLGVYELSLQIEPCPGKQKPPGNFLQ